MPTIEQLMEGHANNARKEVAAKLLKRANKLLEGVDSPDSPMILVATELKIQAEEIFDASTVQEASQ